MDLFAYILILTSVIYALAVAQILEGCGGKLRVIASIEERAARRASLYRLD